MSHKVIETDKSKIACDGGTTSSHPKVWLQIEPSKGEVTCPYCDTKFVNHNANKSH